MEYTIENKNDKRIDENTKKLELLRVCAKQCYVIGFGAWCPCVIYDIAIIMVVNPSSIKDPK